MPAQIHLRFYQQLNDFLPLEWRETDFAHILKQARSVKDLVESIGVPHTEIDLIIVNAKSVDFNYLVHDGDHISLYPLLKPAVTESLNISPLKHNQPEPLDKTRFVLDVHLGRLAAYLRMLGFDTLYRNDYDDPALANISVDEQRILLTCDRKLLMRKQISHGYFVRARLPRQQLLEILTRYDLYNKQKPFSRCMHCNGKTRAVKKQQIETQLLAKTKKYYDEFYQCEVCNKIYWKGSHYLKMKKLIERVNKPD
jgi:hypothetical protein